MKSKGNPSPISEDNFNVVVRVRPLLSKEVETKDPMVIQFPGNGQIYVS